MKLEWKDTKVQIEGRSVPARETEIEHGGKKKRVIIRRMGWAEKELFIEQYVEFQLIGTTQRVIPRPFSMKIGAVQKCTFEAPFELKNKDLDAEDPSMLEQIYKEIERFNRFDEVTKKKLEPPSSEEQRMTGK